MVPANFVVRNFSSRKCYINLFHFMVKFENKRICIVLDEWYNSPEDLMNFVNTLLWYLSHIERDAFCNDHNNYMCELIKMMLPDETQIKI